MREGEQVSPLELFFDLVFVLALTQCTQLMSNFPTWGGVGKGLLVLGLLWWAWVGYSWITSVVDPEDDSVRLVIFAAMAAMLIVALCVPRAFGGLSLEFALAYAAVRYGQLGLFMIASRDAPDLRHSVLTLVGSTTVGVGILVGGSFLDPGAQAAVWAVALVLDMAGPYFFGSEGWRLVPAHFAERHGLIVIIALGESIVAIGVGVAGELSFGQGTAAVLGVALAAAMWWLYFDVVALVAVRRLAQTPPGREQNELARDSYSYLHLPMVAGIVLVALGLKKTIADVGEPLKLVPAAALLGGTSLYLLSHVAFRLRNVHSLNRRRLVVAIVLVALIPLAVELPSLVTAVLLAVVLSALIAYEAIRYAADRDRVRHQLAHEG